MNVIIDPTDNIGYPITSEIGRNILKNYLTNYKNGGSRNFRPVTVYCDEEEGVITCSSKNPSGPQISSFGTSPRPVIRSTRRPINGWVRRRGADNERYYEHTGTREIRPGHNPPPKYEMDLDYEKGGLFRNKPTNIPTVASKNTYLDNIPEKNDKTGWKNFFKNIYK